MHGREHGKYTHAVGDEIGRVFCANDTLAEVGNQERFQVVEYGGVAIRARYQFGKVHISRRVEKMDTAKAVTQRAGKRLGQFVDRETGCIACKNAMFAQM